MDAITDFLLAVAGGSPDLAVALVILVAWNIFNTFVVLGLVARTTDLADDIKRLRR